MPELALIQLDPCPFCGKQDAELYEPPRNTISKQWWVWCSCNAMGPSANNPEEAIRRWNHRGLGSGVEKTER
jgi:Lar family restriction alleviation protein